MHPRAYLPPACGYLWRSEEAIKPPRAAVMGGCEPSDVVTEDANEALWKGNKCS